MVCSRRRPPRKPLDLGAPRVGQKRGSALDQALAPELREIPTNANRTLTAVLSSEAAAEPRDILSILAARPCCTTDKHGSLELEMQISGRASHQQPSSGSQLTCSMVTPLRASSLAPPTNSSEFRTA